MNDRAYIQQAIDYCEKNNMKLTLKQNQRYVLDDTLYFTNIKLDGNGATLALTTADKPILMQRRLVDKTSAFASSTHIQRLRFEGNMSNPKNTGIYTTSFWSKYTELEFVKMGGSAIFLTHLHPDGTSLTSGTLVENMFSDIIVRDTKSTAIVLGDAHGNNKITDGILENIVINTSAEEALRISSSAGWFIRGIHIYRGATLPKVGMRVSNAFNTAITDVYVECYEENAIVFDAIQRNLAVANVNIDATYGLNEYASIYLDRQVIADPSEVGATFTNVNVFHEDPTRIAYIFTMVNSLDAVISNVTRTGSNRNGIFLHDDDNDSKRYRFIMDAIVRGSMHDHDDKYYLRYEGRQLKQSNFTDFTGNSPVTVTFKLPEVWEYSKIICNVSIHSSVWDDGDKVCTWVGQLYISRKNDASDATGVAVYQHDVVAPTGFIANPTVTHAVDGTLTIKFTPSIDNVSDGVVAIDYTVCPW